MRALICDNCPASVPLDQVEASLWIHVGWANGHLHEACTPECAKAIVDTMVAEENAQR